MINFFRKIRKELANENEFLKYSRYAFGEIVLVVIGILIALQINNWNENRKIQKEQNQLIKSIIEDLAKDTILIIEYNEAVKKKWNSNQNIINRIYGPETNLDTLLRIAKKEYSPHLGGSLTNFNNTTFKSLESTGKIELFDDKIKKELLNIHRQQEEFLKMSERMFELIRLKANHYSEKYKFIRQSSEDDTYANKLIWRIDDERDFIVRLSIVIATQNYALYYIREGNENLLNRTKDLLLILQEKSND